MKAGLLAVLMAAAVAGCGRPAPPEPPPGARGSIEVVARLVEIPEGAIFRRELYNYAAILKFQVVEVRRGSLPPGGEIYVGHYNPWKPRAEAADAQVRGIGGSARSFRAGVLYRMTLEPDLDEHFMGGLVDKYFGRRTGPALWALWTDEAG